MNFPHQNSPRSSLFLPRESTFGGLGLRLAHDKLLPSRRTLAILFCSQEPKEDFQASTKAREMGKIWRSYMRSEKNRVLSRSSEFQTVTEAEIDN